MALVMMYTVLLPLDFVAKFTVKNLNKDFTIAGREGRTFVNWSKTERIIWLKIDQNLVKL